MTCVVNFQNSDVTILIFCRNFCSSTTSTVLRLSQISQFAVLCSVADRTNMSSADVYSCK